MPLNHSSIDGNLNSNLTLPSKMTDPTQKYYNENAKDFYDGTVNLDMEALYRPFLQLIPSGGKILDAGCGAGRDSLYFRQMGYDIVAFDYSEELVKLASNLIGSPVMHMSFNDIDYFEEFDGIWACASLLHVPKTEMGTVVGKLTHGLKPKGILYASYKYGENEKIRKHRHFSDYTEIEFEALVKRIPTLSIISQWKTVDVRPNRKNEYWLNVLLRKEY